VVDPCQCEISITCQYGEQFWICLESDDTMELCLGTENDIF